MIGDQELRIRERAHGIWEREGRPEGRAATHWQMATAEIAAEGKGAGKTAKPQAEAAGAGKAAKKPAPARAAAARAADPKRSRKATE